MNYFEGIHQAKEKGLILETQGASDVQDVHNPVASLDYMNTRPLLPVARLVLEKMKSAHASVRYLELGAGAGIAAAEAYEIGGIEVSTASLSPINPFLALRPLEIVLPEIRQKIELIDQMQLHRNMQKRFEVPLQNLIQLQTEMRFDLFKILSEPFIRQQFVGPFASVDFEDRSFDFIYESYGPLSYAVDRGKSMAKALRLLSQKGVMVCYPHHPMDIEMAHATHFGRRSFESLEEYGLNAGDFLLIDPEAPIQGEDFGGVALLAKQESFLVPLLAKQFEPGRPQMAEGLYEALNLLFHS